MSEEKEQIMSEETAKDIMEESGIIGEDEFTASDLLHEFADLHKEMSKVAESHGFNCKIDMVVSNTMNLWVSRKPAQEIQ